MALESQGAKLLRISTVSTDHAQTSTDTLHVDSTNNKIDWSNAAADFSAYTSGMRLVIDGTVNTGVYTIKAVSATSLLLYEPVTAMATGTMYSLSGDKYAEIGEVRSFQALTGSPSIIDVSHLGSTAKEKLVGLNDWGEVSFNCWTQLGTGDTANSTWVQQQMRADRAERTKRQYEIRFTDSSTKPSAINFDAFVTNYSFNAAVDAALESNITLAITSDVKYIRKE